MTTILEGFKEYFENTPKEEIQKAWDETAHLDKLNGPTLKDFQKMMDIMNKNHVPREKSMLICNKRSYLVFNNKKGELSEGVISLIAKSMPNKLYYLNH